MYDYLAFRFLHFQQRHFAVLCKCSCFLFEFICMIDKLFVHYAEKIARSKTQELRTKTCIEAKMLHMEIPWPLYECGTGANGFRYSKQVKTES